MKVMENKNYTCTLITEAVSEADVKVVVDAIEKEDGVTVAHGQVECVFGADKAIVTKNGDVVFGLNAESDDSVQPALEEFFKEVRVAGEFWVTVRAMDFSFFGAYHFANGAVTESEARTCYDNAEAVNAIKDGLKAKGIEVPELYVDGAGFDLANGVKEDEAAFKLLGDPSVASKMFAPGFDFEQGVLDILQPRSVDDLRAFVALTWFSQLPDDEIMANVKLYAERRDGKAPVPENLPESLTKTYGLWLYDEQEKDAVKCGLKPASVSTHGIPCLSLVAKMEAAQMYEFLYLCAKYGVQKDLK